MIEEKVIICNKLGLHARAAAKLVGVASEFAASVEIEKDNKRVNGKSIMGLMMLAAGKGSNLVVRAEGAAIDAERMLGELVDLFERRFEEV